MSVACECRQGGRSMGVAGSRVAWAVSRQVAVLATGSYKIIHESAEFLHM